MRKITQKYAKKPTNEEKLQEIDSAIQTLNRVKEFLVDHLDKEESRITSRLLDQHFDLTAQERYHQEIGKFAQNVRTTN